jgi:hypothetical protein
MNSSDPRTTAGSRRRQAQTDGGRATNQVRGQGFTQVRGKDDRAEFVGPDVAPFKEARESCNDAMREMHRVMFRWRCPRTWTRKRCTFRREQGTGRRHDSGAAQRVRQAIARRFFRRLLVLAALGRGEAPPPCRADGLEHFDIQGTNDAIAEADRAVQRRADPLADCSASCTLARIYTKYLGEVTHEQQVQDPPGDQRLDQRRAAGDRGRHDSRHRRLAVRRPTR